MNRTLRSILAATALVPFVASHTAHGYTTDVFDAAGPTPEPAKAEDSKRGAPEHVDPSGAAVHSIPIPTAPNRRDHVPELALTYSSRNPVRGGVAMGWTMSIPRIELDTSSGRLPLDEPVFRSSMGGKLVRAADPVEDGWIAYRGQEDDSYTRYELQRDGFFQQPRQWRARTPDGRVFYFGETDESRDLPHARAPGAHSGRWFVTRIVDKFGNEIQFTYRKVHEPAPEGVDVIPVDISLDRIEYGANPAAGLDHHARIRFEYAPTLDLCPGSDVPIGAQLDFRTGYPIYQGAERLDAVSLEVVTDGAFQLRRRLELAYDPTELTCAAATDPAAGLAHAPLRVLTAVQEIGYAPDGTATALPPTTFAYNRRQRTFDASRSVEWPLLPGGVRQSTLGFGRDTTTRMMLDLDGDARVDRLTLNDAALDAGYCTASYAQNQGGWFGSATYIGVVPPDRTYPVLPAIPWRGATRDDAGEYCSLTHQVTQVVNYDLWDPSGQQLCDPHDTPSVENPPLRPDEAEAHHTFRFLDVDTDGRPDLVTAIESFPLAYQPGVDPRVGPDLACTPQGCDGTWIDGVGCVVAHDLDHPTCDPDDLTAETQCGRYVYRVHRNLGGGSFGAPTAWAAPVPLDPRQWPDGATRTTVVDLDGDGLLDAVEYEAVNTAQDQRYRVYRGRPDGGFDEEPYLWRLPAIWGHEPSGLTYVEGAPSVSGQVPIVEEDWSNCEGDPIDHDTDPDCAYRTVGAVVRTEASLEDINGDGLPDYVDARGEHAVRVFYNTGAGFETYDGFAATDAGTPLIGNVDPGFGVALEVTERRFGPGGERTGGRSRHVWRLFDVDSDGLADLVRTADAFGDDVVVYLNVQDRFVRIGSPLAVQRIGDALAAGVVVGGDGSRGAPWEETGGLLDLDGDGLPEAVHDGVAWSDSDTQPMRLLQRVDNGRGLTIDYRYRAVSGDGVPHALWVVSDVTVNPGPDADGAPGASGTTRYEYSGAEYNQDLDGDWGFRGFASTTVTSPSGARTVTQRSFDQSYAGLVTEVRVEDHPLDASTYHAATITRTTYSRDVLPGAPGGDQSGTIDPDPTDDPVGIVTYHVRTKETFTCGAEQSPAECVTTGARRFERQNWIPLPQSAPAMFVQESEWVGDRQTVHPGTQVRGFTHQAIVEPGRYLVYPTHESRYEFDDAVVQRLVAYTVRYYDASNRAELYTSRRIDPSTWAVTSHGYDLATGNKISETAPNHFGTQVKKTFAYDATQTFIARTVNELGHEVHTRHDPATGALVEQRGPNVAHAYTGEPVRDGFVRTIDGLGRVLTESVAIDDTLHGYVMVPVSRTSYVDAPRATVTKEQRIELAQDRWAKTEAELDGLGREIVSRAYEGATLRTVSKRYFDAAGNLVLARVPKPFAFDLSTVDWRFVHDPLGRVIREIQPARAGCSGDPTGWDFCGQAWVHDGLTTTRMDVTGTLGGAISETTTTADIFGRLVRVEEATDGDPAVTTYAYDGNDNVRQIVSADGVVTTMRHDDLGRRVEITRGSRTWRYGYDASDNLTSIIAPAPAGADIWEYTTTIAYDALGRETSRIVGRRDLTQDELDRWGDGIVARHYDVGYNGVGRLTAITQDLGATDVSETLYGYDARGNMTREERSISVLDGRIRDTRTTTRTYNAMGQPKVVVTADAADAALATQFLYAYDGRGLPLVVYWLGQSGWLQQVQRTADGRMYHRYYSQDGQLVTQTKWLFDDLGRVTEYHARSMLPGQGVSARAAERFVFDGAGNVATMHTGLWPDAPGSTWPVWSLGYDRQHQLVSATGPLGYTAAFAYTPGGKLDHAAVAADPTTVRVHDRDVAYAYGDGASADPDAPVRLGDAAAPWMAIEYDPAGNAVRRTIDGQTYVHRYDGADLQREVIAPDGSRELSWYGADRMRTLVAEIDPDGTLRRVRWTFGEAEIWYRGDGTIEREAATATIDGAAARVVNHERREILHTDPRGHLLAAVDQHGTLLAGFHYGPYGEILEQAGSEDDDYLKRFNGKEWSATSGLSYYGYRHYDEYALSWTQADPKYVFQADRRPNEPRRRALYTFSLGNPVTMVDADGGDSEDVADAVETAGLWISAIAGIQSKAVGVAAAASLFIHTAWNANDRQRNSRERREHAVIGTYVLPVIYAERDRAIEGGIAPLGDDVKMRDSDRVAEAIQQARVSIAEAQRTGNLDAIEGAIASLQNALRMHYGNDEAYYLLDEGGRAVEVPYSRYSKARRSVAVRCSVNLDGAQCEVAGTTSDKPANEGGGTTQSPSKD